MDETHSRCLIAGGGPAGMMVGYLLARAGIAVTVLEKHRDFLRDFRGDTIHPSTLAVMDELGLLAEFLAIPHQRVELAEGEIGETRVRIADFRHLPAKCRFIAFMPQWDFLNFLAEKAKAFPNFHLLMEAEATGLVTDDRQAVRGVSARLNGQQRQLRADLVIVADGRDSFVRKQPGFSIDNLGAPMDVLWFRMRVLENEHPAVFGRIAGGQALIRLYRGDYWQCGLVIRKGAEATVKQAGIDAFRRRVADLVHRSSFEDVRSWDDVKLLTVSVDRMKTWCREGVLVIGDAAHAMSPIGGVGINLAVQDAVATANLLVEPLKRGRPSLAELQQVQKRRWFPTRATQALQVAIQNRGIDPVLSSERPPSVPLVVKLAQEWPVLQRIPARLVGLGFRPEHVTAPALAATPTAR